MRDSKSMTRRLAVPVAAAFAVTALGAGSALAQDEPAVAGLDQDLTGTTIRVASIGGAPYEAMYDSFAEFEEATGADVEIVFLGDGFQIDRELKTNYGAGTENFDLAWNHTSFMSQYVDFVEPLQDYFTEEELAPFSPSIIEAATIDGNLQLIPRHADISAMHYRTDLFGDADLQAKFEEAYGYPLAPPATLDEMYDMAEFFVSEGVVTFGTQFAGKEEALSGRYYEVLFANGVETESFHPANTALSTISEADRARLLSHLPLIADNPHAYGSYARRNLSSSEAAILLHEAA